MKSKKVVMASVNLIKRYNHEIDLLLDILGHSEALVTDESLIDDFAATKKTLALLAKNVGINISIHDRLVFVAQLYRKYMREVNKEIKNVRHNT